MTIDTRVAGTRSSVFLVATLKTEEGEISVKVRKKDHKVKKKDHRRSKKKTMVKYPL